MEFYKRRMETFPPEYIQLFPTLRCNLSCHFCFNKGVAPVPDMEIDSFEKIVRRLKDRNIGQLDILGGEPTLHPEFREVVDMACRARVKTTVSTNGLNISVLRELHKAHDNNVVRIGVSVNSGQISTELYGYIVDHSPMVKSVYSGKGWRIGALRDFIKVPEAEFYLLFMDAVSRHDLKESVPFYEYYNFLKKLKETYPGINGVFCSGFIPDAVRYPSLKSVRCPAGTTKLSVMPDGSVYPCYLFFRHREFRLGNLLTDDFSSIWNSPLLSFFRTFEGNACPKTSCELFSSCHGGCPAVSLIVSGDLAAPDPRCVRR
jgi:radical SAM protein with 4Fe4S-binding SPASM domain